MKKCACCQIEKPTSEFAKHSGNPPTFLQSYCRPCGLSKSREWSEKNKEKKRLHKKKSRDLNPERTRAVKRAHYARNAEALREQSRNKSPEQRAKRAERQRAYRLRNPEVIRKLNKARIHTQRAAGKITREMIDRLIALQRNRCAICKSLTVRDGKGYHLDHKTPLSAGGTNDFGNLQILCPTCNLKKNARDPIEFMQERGFLL